VLARSVPHRTLLTHPLPCSTPPLHLSAEVPKIVNVKALVGFQVVDVSMVYDPPLVMLSYLKPLFFNSLKHKFASRTTREPKTLEFNKSVKRKETLRLLNS
jgi:hypothetical protein